MSSVPHRALAVLFDRLARGLGALAVTALLFAAHQYWGTDLRTAWTQAHLADQLRDSTSPTATAAATTASGTAASAPTTAGSTSISAQPVTGEPLGRLAVPAVGIDVVVLAGTGREVLQQGPGLLAGTALPATGGNSVIAGHRTTWGAPFGRLAELSPGDEVRWTADGVSTAYTVVAATGGAGSGSVDGAASDGQTGLAARVVSPDDAALVSVQPGEDLITLMTCHPRFSAAQRLVVTARRTTPAEVALAPTVLMSAASAGVPTDPAVSWTDPLPSGTIAVTLWLLGELVAGRRSGRGAAGVARRSAIRVAAFALACPALLVAFDRLADLMPEGI